MRVGGGDGLIEGSMVGWVVARVWLRVRGAGRSKWWAAAVGIVACHVDHPRTFAHKKSPQKKPSIKPSPPPTHHRTLNQTVTAAHPHSVPPPPSPLVTPRFSIYSVDLPNIREWRSEVSQGVMPVHLTVISGVVSQADTPLVEECQAAKATLVRTTMDMPGTCQSQLRTHCMQAVPSVMCVSTESTAYRPLRRRPVSLSPCSAWHQPFGATALLANGAIGRAVPTRVNL
eukprot:COSAG04_NODE_6088_length_1414_cov_8.095817_1_plen_229_part_00